MECQVPTLKDYRRRSGLNQVAVADDVGVAQSIVSRWERGVLPVPEKHLVRLAELYAVDIDEMRNWVYGPEQTVKAPTTWLDHVIDSEQSPYAQLVLLVIMAFRDTKLGVSSFSTEDLWSRARIPEEVREEVWAEVLASGFVRRVGSAEWVFELVYPY